jgi:gluconolactonase
MNLYQNALFLLLLSFTVPAYLEASLHNQPRFAQVDTVKPGNGNSKVIAPNAELQLISKQFKFTEGPATDKKGNVFFTDQPNNKIWKYDIKGRLSVFMDSSGRSNGMYFDKKGNLLSCADEHNQLWSITPQKKVTVLVKDFRGQLLNGPNDVWVDPKGNIYFTDPLYPRPYWQNRKSDIDKERVYSIRQGSNEPVIAADSIVKPNGIIGTPDGKFLYVADAKDSIIYRFQISPDGTLINQTVFVKARADGMTIDNLGNIYLAGNGITVYNSNGEQIEHIDVPSRWTANLTFGGKDRKDLFVTASESVYKIRMKVKGVN